MICCPECNTYPMELALDQGEYLPHCPWCGYVDEIRLPYPEQFLVIRITLVSDNSEDANQKGNKK